jgi:alpha-galactosidase
VAKDGAAEVWMRDLEDGTKAVGLFNRGEGDLTVTAAFKDLGLSGKQKVRDLWRQKDLGEHETAFEASLGRHGVSLIRLSPMRDQ